MTLKSGGYLYISVKHGDFEGERNGRYFTDLTEESLAGIIQGVSGLSLDKTFISKDVRPDREEEWLNAIIRKA